MDLLWKVLIRLFGWNRDDYVNAISIGEDTYIINIHKFISSEKELRKWNDAIKETRASN